MDENARSGLIWHFHPFPPTFLPLHHSKGSIDTIYGFIVLNVFVEEREIWTVNSVFDRARYMGFAQFE